MCVLSMVVTKHSRKEVKLLSMWNGIGRRFRKLNSYRDKTCNISLNRYDENKVLSRISAHLFSCLGVLSFAIKFERDREVNQNKLQISLILVVNDSVDQINI